MKASEILDRVKKRHPQLLNGSTDDVDCIALARDLMVYLSDSGRRFSGGENGRRERLAMQVGCLPYFFHIEDARATVCVLLIPEGQIYCGLAICHVTEQFFRRLGVTCAFGRATKITLEDRSGSKPLTLFPVNRLETQRRLGRAWPLHKAVRYDLLDTDDQDKLFYGKFVRAAQGQLARKTRIAYG